jgi:hypothetical protein
MGIELNWLYIGSIAQALTMARSVTRLCTTPARPEKYEAFLWQPSVLARYDEGRVRPWYQQVKLWFGVYAVVWVYLYWRLW